MSKAKDPTRTGFEELMSKSTEEAATEQEAVDNIELNALLTGEKEIYINGYGELVFQQPTTRLTLQGDTIAAKFRSKHLRSSEILSEAQLKLIYGRAMTIKVEGVDTVIGDGSWTESHSTRMEELPDHIERNMQMVLSCREGISESMTKLSVIPEENSEERKKAAKRLEDLNNEAYPIYLGILKDRKELLELQVLKLQLFSTSLEEQTNLEKIKLFAPSCIKKRIGKELVPVWADEEAFLDDNIGAINLLSLFNLYLRGVDISFFGDAPEEVTSSPDTSTEKMQDSPSS